MAGMGLGGCRAPAPSSILIPLPFSRLDPNQYNEDTHTVSNTLEQSWITAAIKAIGSEEPEAGPQMEAIQAVKDLITEACNFTPPTGHIKCTNVDAGLLEAWRIAASHPDCYIAKWMGSGAPAGILSPIPDPGIFPSCTKPATSEPLELHSDAELMSV